LSRRAFLVSLSKLAGSTTAAMTLLPLLQNDYARAAMVPPDDERLAIDRVSCKSPRGAINGYLARLKDKARRAAVLVIHENRGLNPHLEDIARRLALEGFLAYAVDLLSLVGGTPENEDTARELHTKMNQDDAVVALVAAVSFLKQHSESNGKLGAVGFCFGGLMVNRLAVASRELDAGVAYYGRQVRAGDVPRIKAALLLHYAEHDAGVNAGITAHEAALKEHGKTFKIHRYPGTQHASTTIPARPAATRKLRTWPGAERCHSCGNISGSRPDREPAKLNFASE
jgi:carboxymethylenebutenolidase